ncbi:MAG TPA: hypothetical protein VMH02_08190 [Verrucomicrobiae bacterium]|nr:hypothetical protein [Verrucomicrobiae bacterium]
MKPFALALAGALAAAGIAPALAADLSVPVASTAPTVDPNADITTFTPAAVADLGWNSTDSRAAGEDTSARVTTDGKYLYVRFDATQKERIVSAPVADGKSNGDLVWVDLWPSGSSGTEYRFISSPDGTSEATASSGTAPAFSASGTTFDGGYTVTMKIPLDSLRGASANGAWNVQFARSIHSSGEQMVWSHEAGSASPDDLAAAGTMTLPSVAADVQH